MIVFYNTYETLTLMAFILNPYRYSEIKRINPLEDRMD
jgi:hypothetical protein